MSSRQNLLEGFFEAYFLGSLPLDYKASYLKSLALGPAGKSNVYMGKKSLGYHFKM